MTHAVVIGASIAGLTAAQALSSRFDEVTVLDRDVLPGDSSARRGVPQGKHVHILLAAGQRALDELFPGVGEDMTAAGAIPFDPGTDLGFHRDGKVWPRVSLGLRLVSFSRPLLENVLRQRLAPNVSLRDNTSVSGLTGGTSVTGVRVEGTEIAADLVVDASGRGSRSDRWLDQLGFPAPATAEVKIDVGYASQFLHRDPGFLPEGVGIFIVPAPPAEKRAGVLVPVEDNRWLVTLGGWHGQYPRTEAEFIKHARDLPDPTIANMLESQQPASTISYVSFPASRRRYFEKLRRLPSGYVAIGDAICSFNPIYGQGMTAAAMEAVALGRLLDQGPLQPRAFYRSVKQILTAPWRFAVGGDFIYPETTGDKPFGIGLLNGYAARIQRAAGHDDDVRRTFFSIQHLVTPPSALFRPSIVAKALRSRA